VKIHTCNTNDAALHSVEPGRTWVIIHAHSRTNGTSTREKDMEPSSAEGKHCIDYHQARVKPSPGAYVHAHAAHDFPLNK